MQQETITEVNNYCDIHKQIYNYSPIMGYGCYKCYNDLVYDFKRK